MKGGENTLKLYCKYYALSYQPEIKYLDDFWFTANKAFPIYVSFISHRLEIKELSKSFDNFK